MHGAPSSSSHAVGLETPWLSTPAEMLLFLIDFSIHGGTPETLSPQVVENFGRKVKSFDESHFKVMLSVTGDHLMTDIRIY